MLRVRQDWFDELDEMQRQMERFLEHFTSCKRPAVMFSTGVWQPLVDVYETPEEVVVVAELAGVAQGDVSIVLHNNTLLLSGERRDRRAGKTRTYQLMELNYGRFQRAVELSCAVDGENAAATLEDGFLVITLRKAALPIMKRVPIEIVVEAEERQE